MNLRKHELIGLEVEVLHATDPSQAHVRGRVVDETRNTLVLEIQGGLEVDGEEIRFRPEDRVKKAR